MEKEWIHILLRGEKNPEEDEVSTEDDYLIEFRSKNLKAITVPVLQFEYKNLPELADLIQYSNQDTAKLCSGAQYGLVITSPRVVEAIHRSVQLIDPYKREVVLRSLNPELNFVVGEKSAKLLQKRLRLRCNLESTQTGTSSALSRYIADYCTKHKSSTSIRLIYPKGSRSDSNIEDFFGQYNSPQIKLYPITVYDTNTVNNTEENVLLKFQKEIVTNKNALCVVINVIFFSPSGIEGFIKMNRTELINQLKTSYKEEVEIQFKYSSIGKTTESAMIQNKMEVFAVSTKPSPISLLDSILKKIEETK